MIIGTFTQRPSCRFLSLILFFSFTLASFSLSAQEAHSEEEKTEYIFQTFRGTRVVNGQSVETNPAKTITFWISHRFGNFGDGWRNIWGLDNARIRIGADYGITDRFMIGFGRSQQRATYDLFAKYRIFRQRKGLSSFPFSISWFSSMSIEALELPDLPENTFSSRIVYAHQLLIARKFGERFSLQVMPTLVHRNVVATEEESNDVFSVGFAPRIQVSKIFALIGEYHYVFPNQLADRFEDSFSLGFELNTKGHVFQISLSNASGMIERFFITETTAPWSWDLDRVRIGFNITRNWIVGPRNR